MTRQVPWLRVFVEGAVIVGSILLAFGIDAWWDGMKEGREEQILLQSLQAEFAVSRDTLAIAIDTHRMLADDALRVAEFGLASGAEVPSALSSWAYETFYIAHTTHLNTGTLDGTVASGRLGLVSSDELRSKLAAWPSFFGEFVEQEVLINDWIFQDAGRLVYQSFPVAEGIVESFGGSGSFMWPPPEWPATRRMVDFVTSEAGQNLAAQRFVLELVAVRDAEMLLTVVDDLLRLLEAEIE